MFTPSAAKDIKIQSKKHQKTFSLKTEVNANHEELYLNSNIYRETLDLIERHKYS